jgi:hypothetical protein
VKALENLQQESLFFLPFRQVDKLRAKLCQLGRSAGNSIGRPFGRVMRRRQRDRRVMRTPSKFPLTRLDHLPINARQLASHNVLDCKTPKIHRQSSSISTLKGKLAEHFLFLFQSGRYSFLFRSEVPQMLKAATQIVNIGTSRPLRMLSLTDAVGRRKSPANCTPGVSCVLLPVAGGRFDRRLSRPSPSR